MTEPETRYLLSELEIGDLIAHGAVTAVPRFLPTAKLEAIAAEVWSKHPELQHKVHVCPAPEAAALDEEFWYVARIAAAGFPLVGKDGLPVRNIAVNAAIHAAKKRLAAPRAAEDGEQEANGE